MPQLQVLNRTEDPNARMISEAGDSIAQIILKKQAMAITEQELKIKAKAATDDASKMRLDQEKQAFEVIKAIHEGELKGPLAGVMLKRSLEAAGLSLKDVVSVSEQVMRNYQDLAKASGPGEDEATQAQKRFADMEGSKRNDALMQQLLQGQGEQQPDLGEQQSNNTAVPNPRAGAVAGTQVPPRMGITSFGPSGAQAGITPEYSAYLSNAMAEQKEVMKRKSSAEGQLVRTEQFVNTLAESYEELEKSIFAGGREPTVTGRLTREGARAAMSVGVLPKTAAFNKMIKVAANQQAREIEGGRVTDQDREVYAAAMANAVEASTPENILLVRNSMITLKNLGADIYPVIRKFKASNVPLLQKVAEAVLKDSPDPGSTKIGAFLVEELK